MSGAAAVGASVGAAAGLLTSPYLARLTRSVPDRELSSWWRGLPVGRTRVLATAAVAVVAGALGGAAAGAGAVLPAFVALTLLCTPLVVIDYDCHRLPNRLVVPAAASGAVLLAFAAALDGDWRSWLRAVGAAAIVYAVLFLLALISPASFGYGDVKLGGVLAGYLGWFSWAHVYYGLFAGFLVGGLVAVSLLITRRATMKTHIPLGPSLIAGALLVLAFDLVPSLT